MEKFRVRFVSILVVAVFLAVFNEMGHAQMQCTPSVAVPPPVRIEGLAELVGDCVLICTGGVAGTPVTTSFELFMDTNVTSRLTAIPTTEALLLIDEPSPGNQVLNENVFQGQLLSGGLGVIWPNITFTEPGVGGQRIFRFTNMRANASIISGNPGQILGLLSASGGPVPILNPQFILALTGQGMNFSASSVVFNKYLAPGDSGNPSQFLITFSEAFTTSFKKRIEGTFQNTPGLIFNTESGFTSSITGAAGLADSGTRLVARFSNVPAGISLSVPTSVTSGDFTAVLMSGTNSDFSGGSPAVSGNVSLIGGSGSAVWEVTSASPVLIENISIPVTVSYAPGAPASGTALVNGTLGPISTVAEASATDPLPRFVDQSTSVTAFRIGQSNVDTVPTINEWGMIIFMVLAGLGAVYHMRRQRRT